MSTLDKHMLKELLLVCSALGSVETADQDEDNEGTHRFVRGENCLEWLQDLQRALRRDDDNTRDICITISSWKVVQQKLIPLILECRDDAVLVKTLVKIYVMLTMPLSKQAEEALSKPVNPKAQGDVRDQQTRRRDNAIAQQVALHSFKRAFISIDFLSVIVGMLEEPLSHTGVSRTEEDNFSIELCLTLLRNVLNIRDPSAALVTSLGENYSQMHEQLLVLFQGALLLDILLLLAQDVHARENAKLNLLLVEIFNCIIRDQDPAALIAVHRARVHREAYKGTRGGPSPAAPTDGSLMSVLAKEKSKRGMVAAQMHSRHARFGGTLQIGGGDGTTSRIVANPFKDQVDSVPQATRKRSKGGKTFLIDEFSGPSLSDSPKAILAREALYDFSCSFLKTAYDPFMRSIKNEFRIDSSRLQPEDKGMMFRLMYFFMSFHHQKHQEAVKSVAEARRKDATESPKFELGYVLETMDLMSFNLVLREAETSMAEKNTTRLAECVLVLKEMVHVVTILNESSEKAHQLVALGLLARIFYAAEPLDKLHDIVRAWKPVKFTKSFLCHLVELIHTTLKTLEWYKSDKAKYIGGVDISALDGKALKGVMDKAVLDRVVAAKKFDFERYFRRLVKNDTVRMYTHLLEHYATNSARTNHYILSFMMRLSNFTRGQVSNKRRGNSTEEAKENDRVSLEPMLYNIYTLGVFQKILDDPVSRKSPFKHLVHYILSVVRHFGALAQKNHLIFVETLFQHPNPQPFCETLLNVYHDGGYEDEEDAEPRKAKKTSEEEASRDSDSEDGNDHDSTEALAAAGGVGNAITGQDEADEEEWNEGNQENRQEQEERIEDPEKKGPGGVKRKKTGKDGRRRKGSLESGRKKRVPRWTKEEDAHLREQYPKYEGTSSVFEVLSAAAEMEVKGRTEEQIKARVKKLGLAAANKTLPSSANNAGENEQSDDPGDANAEQDKFLSRDDKAARDFAKAKPVLVRKMNHSNQEVSDADSEGLFSSAEDDEERNSIQEATTSLPSDGRQSKRPVFEDSDDE